MPRNIDDLVHCHAGAVIGVFVPLSQNEAAALDTDDDDDE